MHSRAPHAADIPLGNEAALKAGQGPGSGRTIHRSGTQGHHTEAAREPTHSRVERGEHRLAEAKRKPTPNPGHGLGPYGAEIGRGTK